MTAVTPMTHTDPRIAGRAPARSGDDAGNSVKSRSVN
jgi:hypothetical protein